MPVLHLLRALIDPGADDADFFRGEFGIFLFFRRGHEFVGITKEGDVGDEETFGAVTGFEDFAVHAAFERAGEGIQPEFAFRLFRAVAIDAGFVKKWFDVLFEGEALPGGRRG